MAEPKTKTTATNGTEKLLTSPISVINVGLEGFAIELHGLGVPVVHVRWSPPAGGDAKLAALLAKLGA